MFLHVFFMDLYPSRKVLQVDDGLDGVGFMLFSLARERYLLGYECRKIGKPLSEFPHVAAMIHLATSQKCLQVLANLNLSYLAVG